MPSDISPPDSWELTDETSQVRVAVLWNAERLTLQLVVTDLTDRQNETVNNYDLSQTFTAKQVFGWSSLSPVYGRMYIQGRVQNMGPVTTRNRTWFEDSQLEQKMTELYTWMLAYHGQCDECSELGCDAEDHTVCDTCDRVFDSSDMEETEIFDTSHCSVSLGTYIVCQGCYEALGYCERGERITRRYTTHYDEQLGADVCVECWELNNRSCDDCGETISIDYSLCDYCEASSTERWIKNYSYRPELIFHPERPPRSKKLEPLYIGIEMEMSFWNTEWEYPESAVGTLIGEWSDLLYAKEDASITNGFELVTHPMQPQWAMENFPWEVLDTLLKEYSMKEEHDSCGVHIHMNKAAFTTSHLWKFLQLHHRMPDFCKLVGGRGDTHYATFSAFKSYHTRKDLKMISQNAKKSGVHGYSRYMAINLENRHTIELRYPEGRVTVNAMKKNIEWVQMLFDYTREVSVEQVKKGVLDDPGYLLGYMQKNGYKHLTDYVMSRLYIPKDMPEKESN